jgi:spore maturation protein CgeB
MEEQSSNLRGCKIAISHSNFNHSKYISDRLLRIMGAGAFCLSHRFDDYQELYTEGKDIVTYSNTADMIDKCKYYLANEAERNKIASNGYDLTHKLYTWDSFVTNLIKICE